MKLGQIANKEAQELVRSIMGVKLPAKTSFRLKTTVKRMLEELDKYNASREEALQRHGTKDKDGKLIVSSDGNVQFNQEGMRAFIEEINELNNVEIDIPTISIDELDGHITLSVEELILLDGLIV